MLLLGSRTKPCDPRCRETSAGHMWQILVLAKPVLSAYAARRKGQSPLHPTNFSQN